MGTNLFPPPFPFFRYFSFTAPLTSLFSFFFFRCAFQLRDSLSFFPSLNQCCFFKLTLRDIGFRTRFYRVFSSLYFYSFPFIFLLLRKLSSALSPRGRRKIDLEKVANETQHGIGLRRTNSSRKRFLSLYPLLFPFLLPFPLLARRETKGSFLPRH